MAHFIEGPASGPRLRYANIDVADLSLSLAQAWRLPEAELRERFTLLAWHFMGTFDDGALPERFPKHPGRLTRAAIMVALQDYAYWFDPLGGHPDPRIGMAAAGSQDDPFSSTARRR